eukprot:scaffold39596_cov191-Amphora_coffeaeformis.AAC.1
MQVAQQHHQQQQQQHGGGGGGTGTAAAGGGGGGAWNPHLPPGLSLLPPSAPPFATQQQQQQQLKHPSDIQRQEQQQQEQHQPGEESSYRNFRRKRSSHQRPAAFLEVPIQAASAAAYGTNTNTTHINNNNKVRRRLRSDNDSSSSGSSSFTTLSASGTRQHHHHHQQQNHNHHHHHHRHSSKKKKLTDVGLLGKSAVKALHEWCDKRYYQPIFWTTESTNTTPNATTLPKQAESSAESGGSGGGSGSTGVRWFDITVVLEHDPTTILGRGKGTTKYAAKQLAARRALQRLVPGAVFDEGTGILMSLNNANNNSTSPATTTAAGRGGATSSPATWNVPQDAQHAATSADHHKNDEPEDLAHLAKQLAIQEKDTTNSNNNNGRRSSHHPPKRTLDVYPGTSTTSEDDDCNDTYYSTRGDSVCTSLLFAMHQIDNDLPESPEYSYAVDPAWARRKVSAKTHYTVQRPPNTCTARLQKRQADGSTIVLEAVGVGANKREARHVASARLLALLFPECSTMMEVKAAAEATREQYARSRHTGRGKKPPPSSSVERSSNRWTAMRKALEDTNFSDVARERFRKHVLSDSLAAGSAEVDTEVRQSSRLRQVEVEVDQALQRLKDEHESLPEELTEDNVGRTCLRRAGPEDLLRIRKLLFPDNLPSVSDENLTRRLWSTSSFVLVLCRAIAALEDPPLGCAVLTLGFEMAKGKVLRVAQIGNELHLPRERLVECLQTFAVCMNATLVAGTLAETTETMPWYLPWPLRRRLQHRRRPLCVNGPYNLCKRNKMSRKGPAVSNVVPNNVPPVSPASELVGCDLRLNNTKPTKNDTNKWKDALYHTGPRCSNYKAVFGRAIRMHRAIKNPRHGSDSTKRVRTRFQNLAHRRCVGGRAIASVSIES